MKNAGQHHRRWVILLGAVAALAVLAVLIVLAKYGIGIPCLFYRFTGLQCPGCGNSRAALALLRLDLPAALGYNFLFPLEFSYLLWVVLHCCRSYLKGKGFRYQPPCIALDIGVLAAVVIWWIVRNFL